MRAEARGHAAEAQAKTAANTATAGAAAYFQLMITSSFQA